MGFINFQVQAETEPSCSADLDVQTGAAAKQSSLFIVSERARGGAFVKPGLKSLFYYYRDQPKYNHCIHLGWLLGKEVGDLISQVTVPWTHHQWHRGDPVPPSESEVRVIGLRKPLSPSIRHLRKHLWWGPHTPEPQNFPCTISLEFQYCVWNQMT